MAEEKKYSLELPKAKDAFQFNARLVLQEVTGAKAASVEELLEYLRTAPEAVIYHHTHRFLQQHQFLSPEPPNDFSYWVREILGLDSLGEQLVSISPDEFTSIEAIRQKLIDILEHHVKKNQRSRYAFPGEEFYFIKSISFVFPVGHVAHDLQEFLDGLRQVTIDSFYFHMFEAKLRLKRGSNDFSFWLDTNLGEKELAQQLAKLDPYTYTMDSLRHTIINVIEKRINELIRIS